jgi:choloylglycine hydrolase
VKKNLSSIIFIIISICLVPGAGFPCSTFVLDNNGQPVYGKNYDWQHVPCFVIVNKRGVAKTSLPFPTLEPDAQQISWTSKFGSVTFPFPGREFPFEGINEAGLFVSSMALFNDTEYPQPDSRIPVNGLQWVQYQLDNFSTVDEVITSAQNIRLQGQNSNGIHYLVGDSTGNCASIELLGGKMVCHTGATLPYKVLTNSTYDQSVAFLKWFWGYG